MAINVAAGSPSPVRAVAYVRVSQARQGMVSPELQLRAITDYCQRRGYQITETLQDLDLSGRFWRLRQVERAIGMVEADEADVIVVWRWSRVSRNRLDWAIAVDRVEAAGGRLESATEGFDTTTSTGRLARGVLAELAAFESDRTADVWREVKDRRVSQGLPPNGHAQFGYRKRPDGSYVPDRRTGPVLAELYQRYVDGERNHALMRWLNERKIRTPRTGRPWQQQTLNQSMDNGFAAGYVKHRGQLTPGQHTALISEELWQAYLAARDSRRQVHAPRDGTHLLTGLLWCGCGGRMHNNRKTGPQTRAQYTCFDHPQTRAGTCISRDRCDSMVRRWLHVLVTDNAVRTATEAAAVGWVQDQAARAGELRARAVAAPVEERDALLTELAAIRAAAALPAPVELARAVLEDWDVVSPEALQGRLRALLTRVEVFNDRPEPLLYLHTTWGTVVPFVGWKAQARPATPQLPARETCPVAAAASTEGAPTTASAVDPLQLLTPGEAARVARVTVHTLRSWDEAGLLPHTQQSLGRGRLYCIQDLRTVRPSARHTGGWDTRRQAAQAAGLVVAAQEDVQ